MTQINKALQEVNKQIRKQAILINKLKIKRYYLQKVEKRLRRGEGV